ncbi:regulatory protein alcR (C6 zinc finger domain-containing protein) [Colletotrichum tofieldiae]|uniref:Regulatory protein alcR (C6 zinc finger domain-containing protein) n=1 Tax=Colletotrichum tofieldiae TaxID=708197 RepID=A0A161W6H5_9PEZI|nr:regulatory protein alcR (C6 zinc finger domain-containing protein) [Colletotrichum tofieldiae]
MPCSNCTKTRKNCTFDWARSQQVQIRGNRKSSEKTTLASHKRLKSGHETARSPIRELGKAHVGEFQSIPFENTFNCFNTELPGVPDFPVMDAQFTPNLFMPSSNIDSASHDVSLGDPSFILPSSSSMSIPSLPDEPLDLDQTDSNSSHNPSMSGFSPDPALFITKESRKRSWQSQSSPTYTHFGPSEFSPTQRMIVRTNNGLMTANLMQLYHDVMEGALSCWLTEQNCPYLTPNKGPRLSGLSDIQSHESISVPSNIPNRIYRRVLKLDKSLDSLGIKPLTSSEDKRATKALHLAIMAFTAQWAQGSQRSQERYHGQKVFGEDLLSNGFGEEFDTALQVSFWKQAKKCLDDCAEIGSFKVAMAELLFGLTQKHNDEFHWNDNGFCRSMSSQAEESGSKRSCTAKKVQGVLDEEGYSIYVERGARRLHVLKHRSESFERRRQQPGRSSMAGEYLGDDSHGEEKATMKLIFWLAVMFDTLSAAITERPLTVSDEDSKEREIRRVTMDENESASSISNERWNDRYIIKKNQNLAPLRLPCAEEDISRELIDAAPVKVLLFRKITRIQSLSSRGASQCKIEDSIQDGLAVYRHWNMTYGPLFQDCLQCHDSLPSKIQSWYVCLLGHWLLAVMLIADCIKLMDEQDLSVPARAKERGEATLTDHLRRTSMRAVSDLARASTPREDGIGRLANFHMAVNDGALLTEPWTMVLIRSFAMAGTLFLDDAINANNPSLCTNRSQLEPLSRCEDCVKALWYLGRKSSLSRQVAIILGDGLDTQRTKILDLEGLAACDSLACLNSLESL